MYSGLLAVNSLNLLSNILSQLQFSAKDQEVVSDLDFMRGHWHSFCIKWVNEVVYIVDSIVTKWIVLFDSLEAI